MLCASGEDSLLGQHSAAAAAAALISNTTGSVTTPLPTSRPAVWMVSVSNTTIWQLDTLDHGQPGWIARLPISSVVGMNAVESSSTQPSTNHVSYKYAHTGQFMDECPNLTSSDLTIPI